MMIVLLAIGVISMVILFLLSGNNVKSIFALCGIFLLIAVFFGLNQAPILAALQVVINVGGVLVLMLFGAFLNKNTHFSVKTILRNHGSVFLFSVFFSGVVAWILSKYKMLQQSMGQLNGGSENIGKQFIDNHVFGFEFLGLFLLGILVISTFIAKS